MQKQRAGLNQQLAAFYESFHRRLPAAERARFAPANEAARRALQDRPVPQPGDVAPDFALPDQHGRVVRLAERLAHGPVVLLFVRGGWCPLCTLTLRAYQTWLPAIHEAGADLLAITPQPASTCCLMAERDLLAFQTLSDHDNRVAAAYGIAFEMDPLLRPMHLRLGNDIPRLNGTGNWTVPLPATFIVGTDGRVVLSHVEVSNHLRLDPADAVAALQRVGAAAAAD
jgi:peroxiredoxin